MLPYTAEDSMLINSGDFNTLGNLEAQQANGRLCRGNGIWQGNGYVSAERLGYQPPTLLGHAHPNALLRKRRHRSCARHQLPVLLPENVEITQTGGSPLGRLAGIRERYMSEMWRPRAPRDRHHGYVRRFFLVFLPLYQREELTRRHLIPPRCILVPHRPVHRWSRACDPAPDLLALLDQGHARPRPDPERRAHRAPVHAGHGHQRRREDVEVEGQRSLAR